MITIEITYPGEPLFVLPAVDSEETAMGLLAWILECAHWQEVEHLEVRVTGAPTAAASRRPDLYPTGV